MTLHPPPIAGLGRDCSSPSDREHRARPSRRQADGRRPATGGRRAERGAAVRRGVRGHRSGRGRARARSSRSDVVAQQVGLACDERGRRRARRCRRATAAPRAGSGCAGTAGRRSSGPAPVGVRARAQRTRLGAAQRQQRAAVAAHAREAIEAGAAEQVQQHGLGLVVGGVAGEDIGRAAPRSGPHAPGLRGWDPERRAPRSARNPAPQAHATAATISASAADPGRRPWSTCTAVTSQPAAAARTSRADGVGSARDTAQVTAVPPARERAAAPPAGATAHGNGGRRHPRSRGSGRGSRRAWEGSPGPPSTGRGARARPHARRRR